MTFELICACRFSKRFQHLSTRLCWCQQCQHCRTVRNKESLSQKPCGGDRVSFSACTRRPGLCPCPLSTTGWAGLQCHRLFLYQVSPLYFASGIWRSFLNDLKFVPTVVQKDFNTCLYCYCKITLPSLIKSVRWVLDVNNLW